MSDTQNRKSVDVHIRISIKVEVTEQGEKELREALNQHRKKDFTIVQSGGTAWLFLHGKGPTALFGTALELVGLMEGRDT